MGLTHGELQPRPPESLLKRLLKTQNVAVFCDLPLSDILLMIRRPKGWKVDFDVGKYTRRGA